ncbi:type II toxin-antitoxin system Phd/YefM family antitoxin [Methylobacterium sp. A49B]|uniref:Antitoxin n=1 Tax=Methylobacterium mesophilicum SR1.6/6 TaxID=908290 RepID=A0A6B9FLW6_9HYPH|nr:type II toxin-antitoxin system Phd/YefM family antitoxin [Methylobacterium mesophilicum]QGY02706.1 type II toxin-antitoxin system prevent-host-death family antitoxin [Methylobacterium mesophilicum SR1.6/6]
MRTITLDEAETDLSRLVDQAASGDAFIIARDGKPLVRVVPFEGPHAPGKQRIGFLADRVRVPDDFDEMGRSGIEALFEGR